MRILLAGHATSREVLAAARCLGRAGHRVAVAAGSRSSLAGASRYVSSEHRVEPPDLDVAGFVTGVAAAVAETRSEVVLGCGDPELLALSRYRDRLGAMVPLAAHEQVVHAVDKLSLTTEAAASGIIVPETVAADPRAVAAWRGPAVVKARLHWQPGLPREGGRWTSACTVSEGASLVAAVEAVIAAGRVPLLQRPVDGHLIAVAAVRDASGRLLAAQQQRATPTWPPGAGISTRAFTVAVDPTLLAGVRRLLDRLGWVGMVQLQFIAPPEGPPQLIDLNGRPYGSLALALAAGLPLPALWVGGWAPSGPGAPRSPSLPRVGAVRGEPQPPQLSPAGVRYSWLGGDLRRALVERRGGVLVDVAGTLRAWPGAAHPVADARDLGPLRRLPRRAANEVGSGVRRRWAQHVVARG